MQLIWFRNDLRTDDHEWLSTADRHLPLAGVYFFDPRQYEKTPWGFPKTGAFRANFIRESVHALREALGELGIPLLVFHGKPEDVLPELTRELKVTQIFFQKEWTTEEKDVENRCREGCNPNLLWTSAYQQFLFHPRDIPFQQLRDLPDVFTAFRKACEKQSRVRGLFEIPKPREQSIDGLHETGIPSLEELGLQAPKNDPRSAFPFRGGEKAGRERLREYFWERQSLSTYKKTRNGLLGTDYSSKFSAWLAVGALSPRRIYWEVKEYEKTVVRNQDTYWMIFELIWRDYFKFVSMKHGNAIFQLGGILNKEYEWGRDPKLFEAWTEGRTREPFVNANMKELAATGWMSNRGRQNVASYWSKELLQDWRVGASWFESLLIDYDVHSNWGNWMYNSGVGNDPRDRKFNIRMQAERYDAKGRFRKTWLTDA